MGLLSSASRAPDPKTIEPSQPSPPRPAPPKCPAAGVPHVCMSSSPPASAATAAAPRSPLSLADPSCCGLLGPAAVVANAPAIAAGAAGSLAAAKVALNRRPPVSKRVLASRWV